VRRLSEGPTRSWLVSCINKDALADGKQNASYDDQPSGERASNDHVATIRDRNAPDEQSSAAKLVSWPHALTTKTKWSVCTESHGSASKDKQMKTAIEVLKNVHQTGKDHPDVYTAMQVKDEVVVAAIAELSKQLEHFKQSKQDKISPAQLQAMANDLSRGALGGKLARVLASAADKGNEKDAALQIYQFLEAL
jgi:hypothetical protein